LQNSPSTARFVIIHRQNSCCPGWSSSPKPAITEGSFSLVKAILASISINPPFGYLSPQPLGFSKQAFNVPQEARSESDGCPNLLIGMPVVVVKLGHPRSSLLLLSFRLSAFSPKVVARVAWGGEAAFGFPFNESICRWVPTILPFCYIVGLPLNSCPSKFQTGTLLFF